MAKISARGATEVGRVKARTTSGVEFLFVMTSDGRVLRRATGDLATGYILLSRGVAPQRRNIETLRRIVTSCYRMNIIS
jgi:hypothetical protein